MISFEDVKESYHEGAVRVLEGGVGGKDGVVRLNNGVRHGRRRVYRELELRLLAVVGREALEDEGTETGASSTTERVEDEEALEAVGVVRKTAKLFHGGVDELLADGVVSTCIYQRSDEQGSRMEKKRDMHSCSQRPLFLSALFPGGKGIDRCQS